MEQVLDVSGLEAPEPMEQSLLAIDGLERGDYLRILHRREPFPLYGILASRGFEHRTVPGSDADFEIFVWRTSDHAAQAAVKQVDDA